MIFQDKTRQDKTRQDKTRQDKTRQDKTRQDKTRQDFNFFRYITEYFKSFSRDIFIIFLMGCVMKKVFIFVLFILFLKGSVFGFEAQYFFAGYDLPFFTQSPRHELITAHGLDFLCKKIDESFINENLNSFVDENISTCGDYDNNIKSLYMGVGYNDHPEMDGFTAIDQDDLHTLNWILGASCLAFVPCAGGELALSAGIPFTTACPPFTGLMDQYKGFEICDIAFGGFTVNDQADLGNEDRYSLMHAGMNGKNIGNNPSVFIEVTRNYIRSYFYELVALGLTAEEQEPINKFVHFNDVTQHSSTDTDDFIKTVEFRKILMGPKSFDSEFFLNPV